MDRGPRWARVHPRLHPHVAGAARLVGLGRPPGHSARNDLPARLGSVQHLRLWLLGAADDRGAQHRARLPAGQARELRHRRAALRVSPADQCVAAHVEGVVHLDRPGAAALRAAAAGLAARRRPAPRRVLGHAAARSGRLLGRHPASVGLLHHRAAPARLRHDPAGHQARPRGPGAVHDLGRRRAPPRGLSVTRLGHRASAGGAGRRGGALRRPGIAAGRGLAGRRRSVPARRLGDPPPLSPPRRLGLRIRESQLPGRRRHRRSHRGPAPRRRARGRGRD